MFYVQSSCLIPGGRISPRRPPTVTSRVLLLPLLLCTTNRSEVPIAWITPATARTKSTTVPQLPPLSKVRDAELRLGVPLLGLPLLVSLSKTGVSVSLTNFQGPFNPIMMVRDLLLGLLQQVICTINWVAVLFSSFFFTIKKVVHKWTPSSCCCSFIIIRNPSK